MNETLTLLSANALLVLVFLATALAIYRYVACHVVLLWMMAALAIAGVEIVMTVANDNPSPAFASVANMLNVLCSLCVAKLAMVYVGAKTRWPITLIPAIAINLVGSAFLIAGNGYLSGAIPLQAAAALPMLETAWRFIFYEKRAAVDIAIGTVFSLAAINFIVRIPMFLFVLGINTPRQEVMAFQPMALSMYMVSLMLPIAALLIFASIIGRVMRSYKDQSTLDPLTNIANRRGLEDHYASLNSNGGVVICADIDHFKQVNDKYGHAAGDRVICAFADILARIGCTCARIGGEEFVVFLPNADLAQGHMVAEGLRTALALQTVPARNSDITVTASFGVATANANEPLNAVLERADTALYKAKQSGRDRVYIAEPQVDLAA